MLLFHIKGHSMGDVGGLSPNVAWLFLRERNLNVLYRTGIKKILSFIFLIMIRIVYERKELLCKKVRCKRAFGNVTFLFF